MWWVKYKKEIFISLIISVVVFIVLSVIGFFIILTNQGGILDNAALALINRTNQPNPVLSQDWYVTNAVKKASPAVVSIMIYKNVPILERYFERQDLPGGVQLIIPQLREKGVQSQEVGGGSGFLISADGYIVTNRHVVADTASTYFVYTNDGVKHEAKVIARDPVYDIAVLKISGQNYSYLSLGNSDNLEVGQSVIAIGNALGEFRNTVSVGIVSGLARSIVASDQSGKSEFLDEVIQTDAAINLGNSGGPLLNLKGQAIGVNVATAVGSQNIGFSLPINSVKVIIDSVKQTGKIVRPYLGIRYLAVTQDVQTKYKLPFDYGVLITNEGTGQSAVITGSPAAAAGIVDGDVILELDGDRITIDNILPKLLRDRKVGEKVQLKIWHKGQVIVKTVTLSSIPDNLSTGG